MGKYTEQQKTWAINAALDKRHGGECPFELAAKLLDFTFPLVSPSQSSRQQRTSRKAPKTSPRSPSRSRKSA